MKLRGIAGDTANNTVEIAALLAVPAVLVLCAALRVEQTMLISTAAVVAAMVPMFFNLERSRLKPRDIMPIVVFAALAVAGRIILAPFPNIKPVSAIVIMAGISFGKQSGFAVGALTALVSNLFFGEGVWTPWQMYAWGLMGYFAGILASAGAFKHKAPVFIYGFFAPIGFGLIMDSYYIFGLFGQLTPDAVLLYFAAGMIPSIIHATATVVFLVPIYQPWSRKLERLKRKYGIGGLGNL
jgi:energy-coupling factor transport system substrate-specific component